MLAGKGIVTAGSGNKKGKGIVRAVSENKTGNGVIAKRQGRNNCKSRL